MTLPRDFAFGASLLQETGVLRLPTMKGMDEVLRLADIVYTKRATRKSAKKEIRALKQLGYWVVWDPIHRGLEIKQGGNHGTR